VTTLIEHYDTAGDVPETGTVRFWPPQERPAAHGPGRISTTTVTATLSNDDLSVAVEPGLIYVRVLLSGGASNAVIVTVPDSLTAVRLSSLAPMVPPPLLVSTQGPPGPASVAYDTDGVPYLLI